MLFNASDQLVLIGAAQFGATAATYDFGHNRLQLRDSCRSPRMHLHPMRRLLQFHCTMLARMVYVDLPLRIYVCGRLALSKGDIVITEKAFPARQGRRLWAYLV